AVLLATAAASQTPDAVATRDAALQVPVPLSVSDECVIRDYVDAGFRLALVASDIVARVHVVSVAPTRSDHDPCPAATVTITASVIEEIRSTATTRPLTIRWVQDSPAMLMAGEDYLVVLNWSQSHSRYEAG